MKTITIPVKEKQVLTTTVNTIDLVSGSNNVDFLDNVSKSFTINYKLYEKQTVSQNQTFDAENIGFNSPIYQSSNEIRSSIIINSDILDKVKYSDISNTIVSYILTTLNFEKI